MWSTLRDLYDYFVVCYFYCHLYAFMMTSSNGNIFCVTGPHKGQWRGALMFSLICAWIKGWVNNSEAGDLRRHRTHYDVIVMVNDDEHHKTQPYAEPGLDAHFMNGKNQNSEAVLHLSLMLEKYIHVSIMHSFARWRDANTIMLNVSHPWPFLGEFVAVFWQLEICCFISYIIFLIRQKLLVYLSPLFSDNDGGRTTNGTPCYPVYPAHGCHLKDIREC